MTRFPDTENCGPDEIVAAASDAHIAALEAVFGRARLAQGAAGLWQCRPAAEVSCSPASRFYLQRRVGIKGVLDFDAYFRIWARGFFDTRNDSESARVVLMLFLHDNVAALKDLFILDQPANAQVAPDEQAVRACLQAHEEASPVDGEAFAQWVLQAWLPFHLHASGLAPDAQQAMPAQEACALG